MLATTRATVLGRRRAFRSFTLSSVKRTSLLPNTCNLVCSQFHSSQIYRKEENGDKNSKKVVGILGGGIAGLSTAYYLVKQFGDKVHPVIFESSGMTGGWMRTVTTKKGSRYEMGPRTIRPMGISGLNTLDLIEELKLESEVLFVQRSHPTANNRYLYVNEKLVKLPSDSKALFKKQEPFSKPLVMAGLRDLFAMRKRAEDDSIHEFVSRRFGKEIADYLIDPLIRGICAGDARKISVKFLLKNLYELEQNYGSVIVGQLLSKLQGKDKQCKLTEKEKSIGFSKIAISSLNQNWAVWTLEQGLQTFVTALESYLANNKVQIRKHTTVKGLRMAKDVDEVIVDFYTHNDPKRSDSIMVNHVISTIPASQLAKVMRNARLPGGDQEMNDLLETIPSESLQVTGLTYDDPYLIDNDAFGFLVPSCEVSVKGLLGIVFDTNSFPQDDKTIITVMSRSEDLSSQNMDKIKWYVEKTLGIKKDPVDYHSELLTKCIPQYTIGHYEKVDAIRKLIKTSRLPLTLAGASWDGVSVNDVIYSGRKAADEVGEAEFRATEFLKERSSVSS